MNKYLGALPGSRGGQYGANQFVGTAQSFMSNSFSVSDRALLILMENGGIDLGIPEMVDKLIDSLPGASVIGDSIKGQIVDFLRSKLRSISNDILEGAELLLNRYTDAKPGLYSEVTVLRAGAATYQELKSNLLRLSQAKKITDVIILTHGGKDTIWVKSGISGNDIRAIKTANGGPLTIRSVYMMNCVGASMNQAWLDAGARTSAGTIGNNYLPEPTTFFFWNNWKAGQPFETAVTGAYRKTIALMNDAVRGFIDALPIPGTSLIARAVNFENFDFVKQSSPVVQGQRTLTISSDDFDFTKSLSSSLATTVIPVADLHRLAGALSDPTPQEKFTTDNYPYAQATEQKTGIAAVAILAQAALESGWGKSAPGNMFFGVKSTNEKEKRQLVTTFEYNQSDKLTPAQIGLDSIDKIEPTTLNGKPYFKYTGKAWFRAYDSPEESFTDHANLMLNNGRYKKAVEVGKDPYAFFDALQAAGYAQSPTYAQTLKSIAHTIEKYIPKPVPVTSQSRSLSYSPGYGTSRNYSYDKSTHTYTLSDQGVNLIKEFEGFFAKMYNDPVGHCTIGYGTLLHKGNCNGDSSEQPYTGGVTEDKAVDLLKKEASKYEKVLNDNVTVDLNQNQVDSLISFVYNVGAGNFRQSTLLKLLNQGKFSDAKNEFGKWNKARKDGKLIELPGLTKRRKAEADLFGK